MRVVVIVTTIGTPEVLLNELIVVEIHGKGIRAELGTTLSVATVTGYCKLVFGRDSACGGGKGDIAKGSVDSYWSVAIIVTILPYGSDTYYIARRSALYKGEAHIGSEAA